MYYSGLSRVRYIFSILMLTNWLDRTKTHSFTTHNLASQLLIWLNSCFCVLYEAEIGNISCFTFSIPNFVIYIRIYIQEICNTCTCVTFVFWLRPRTYFVTFVISFKKFLSKIDLLTSY